MRQIDRNINLYTALKDAIEKLSIYDYFSTASNSVIRQPSIFGTEEKLLPTGENLNSIIQKLKNNHSLEYEKIEKLLGILILILKTLPLTYLVQRAIYYYEKRI